MSDLKTRLRRLSPRARQLLRQRIAAAREQRSDSCAPKTSRRPATGYSVVDLFTRWTRDTPAAVALADEYRQLSYRQLGVLTSLLAKRLVECGAGPGKFVAFSMQRSIESVVSMVAILKTGAAYVPLDPSNPPARNELILRETGAAGVLITTVNNCSNISTGVALIEVDVSQYDFDQRDDPGPDVVTGADSLAYVMYTSGSSGQPKGVSIEHRGVTRLVCDTNYVDIHPWDRVAHASHIAFDASTFEVWGALLNGARLEIVANQTVLSPASLREEIRERQLSVMFLTTALFNEIANADPTAFARLRVLVFGGEAASLPTVRRVVTFGKPAHLINGYGPTENTTFTTTYEVDDTILDVNRTRVPIGRPISGTYVRVLDEEMREVEPGQQGELFTGGDGLARGYLGRPYLTRNRFIDDPFDGDDGGRMFRTGDLVFIRADRDLEFIGRNDDQIKFRGFRIEPEEIEKCLEELSPVRSALVFAHESANAEKSLLACVQYEPDYPFDSDALRTTTATRLPAYMVPTRWLRVGDWPLTPNGKIDRRELSERADRNEETARPRRAARGRAPSTDVARRLNGLVEDLLGCSDVSEDEDFFEIGGHSLLAMRLIDRINKEFRVRLSVRDIFEFSLLSSLAARIETARKPADIENETPDVLRTAASDTYPLSPMQQRLWFFAQLEPGSSAYHVNDAVHLTGPVDIARLEQALDIVVARHDSLRTCFAQRGDLIVQCVLPANPISLPLTPASEGSELDCRLRRLFEEPFDLYRGPLLRIELIEIGADEYVLSTVMHHIISDGWSLEIFRRELGEAYRALRDNETPVLPILIEQYGTYSRRRNEFGRDPDYARQLAYWKSALADLPTLDLPTDFPRPQYSDSAGAECRATLDPQLTERIRKLCVDRGVTAFMLLMAVYQLLLARVSDQTDIAVGIPIAGRDSSETEPMIGFFVNSLVIRGDLAGNPSFVQLLQQVRETAIAAYDNQSIAFDRLVEELGPARDLSRNPLFDVMLNFSNEKLEVDFADLAAKRLRPAFNAARFALTLYVFEHESGFDLHLVYQTALFSRQRTMRLLSQFVSLLEQIVQNPSQTIDRYTLVLPADRAVLPDPRCPIAPVPLPGVLSQFLGIASRNPDATAISTAFQTVRYRELAANARALAEHLQQTGTHGGDVIAVSGDTSVGVVTAIVAVLLVAGVVMPIDPRLPTRRKQLMLEQARANRLLWVGESGDRCAFDDCDALPRIRLCPESGLPPDLTVGNAAAFRFVEPDPEAPAYIFFTSGSTGVPKAVLGCHKGLNHFINWQIERFGITPADRVAQLTMLSFDVLLRDLFLPLASGATLCLPTLQQSIAPLRWLDEAGITVLHVVPTLASNWLRQAPANVSLNGLRWIFFAGEFLHRSLVEKWRSTFPRAGREVNLYGPTETTLVKSYYEVPSEMSALTLPIGTPLPQTQFLVLRGARHLCGIGERGEIAIRTPYRTLGYLNSANDTGARFVQNPFTSEPGDVIYLTGDCGVYEPDGSVQLLGRLDDEVKIRGVRIDPAEVAAVLDRHEAIDDCHVAAVKDGRGDTMLTGYFVAKHAHAASAKALKIYLERELPSPMIPTAFVSLTAIPRLANGKIDRKSLPPPAVQNPDTCVAPKTEIECQLASIWSGLLQLGQVGIEDDFFLLGGHSLLAGQLLLRIEELLGIQLSMRAIFETPTIEGLARRVETLKRTPPAVVQAKESQIGRA
ncbi:MAG: amino acid adenylation domain-containing protein, partial [Gammaproteobacteria bacterium]